MPEKKVLLVEDDQMILSMYETKLKQAGYFVITADNGADGLRMALEEKPDIILLDVILPQLDGFSVLEEIKSRENQKALPVIMLTNLATEDDKAKGIKLGAVDYLLKSNMTPAQLVDTIRKYLPLVDPFSRKEREE
jgi:two-component system, OmpR family, alkaline phosphatase synthesis response regulator PhoP